jgi:hypothetical protein
MEPDRRPTTPAARPTTPAAQQVAHPETSVAPESPAPPTAKVELHRMNRQALFVGGGLLLVAMFAVVVALLVRPATPVLPGVAPTTAIPAVPVNPHKLGIRPPKTVSSINHPLPQGIDIAAGVGFEINGTTVAIALRGTTSSATQEAVRGNTVTVSCVESGRSHQLLSRQAQWGKHSDSLNVTLKHRTHFSACSLLSESGTTIARAPIAAPKIAPLDH